MLYLDDFYRFSTKIKHEVNGDKAFTVIHEAVPSGKENLYVFCVMDGVSNTDGASKSSEMASEVIRSNLEQLFSNIDSLAEADDTSRMQFFFTVMRNAILSADRALWDAMGYYATTASIAIVFDGWVYTANVGDSPIYLYDNFTAKLNELYFCHNKAAYKVRSGEITKEEALTDGGKNQLMKVVGGAKMLLTDTDVSTQRMQLSQDSVLLLGSDGALGIFSEEKLSEILRSDYQSIKGLCNMVYDQVVDAGGEDDTTLMAARIRKGF